MTAMSPVVVQRLLALDRANGVRAEGSLVKQRIRRLPRSESRDLVVSLLENPPEGVMALTVWGLLRAVRGGSETRVRLWLGRAGLFPQKRVRELTVRQRLELAGILRDWS